MARGQDFDEVELPSKNDTPRIGDLVTLYTYPDGKYGTVRFIGPLYAYGGHWVKTKKKDGNMGSFYTLCSAWDPETSKFDSTKECAWCNNVDSTILGERTISRSLEYYSNVIDRKAQRNKPEDAGEPTKKELKTGFITKDSDTWTPVKACRCTTNVVKQVQGLKELNVHEDENGDTKGFSVSHPKFGMDVNLKYDSKASSPSQAYSVQRGDSTVLKASEKKYLIWDLSNLLPTPSEEEVQEAYDGWLSRNGGKAAIKKKGKADDDFDDDDDKPAKKKKKVSNDDDFDDDDDDTPSKKKKKPVKDDFDDEEEDDEEPPAKKKKKPVKDDFDEDEDDDPPPKKKKRPVDDEDEDEDDDPPPAKKKPSKKRPVDDDEEEDEDTPPPKKGKKKPVEEDDDEDEDEDEDPPPKKKKPTKKKPVDDDEDDDGL